MRKSKLFKIMSVLLMSVMILTLSACGGGDTAGSSTSADSEAAAEVNFSAGLNDDGTLKDVDPAGLVKVADYEAIEIPKSEAEVTDEEVQSEADAILASYPQTKAVKDRAVEDGDTVNIDYVGRIDDEEFPGGTTEANGTEVTIGVTQYIDDFLEQLIGHTPGETFDIHVTFPEDYGNEDLNGKDAVFETTINFIVETETPELTDEFVKENLEEAYGYTSVEDMKSKLKESMTRSKKENYAWEYILENSEFETLPEELVESQIDLRMDVVEMQMAYSGATLEDYISAYGYADEKELRESFRESCETLVKEYISFQVIFEEEGLKVTDEDLKKFFGEEDMSSYIGYYGEGYINRLAMDSKVMEYLVENAVIK